MMNADLAEIVHLQVLAGQEADLSTPTGEAHEMLTADDLRPCYDLSRK